LPHCLLHPLLSLSLLLVHVCSAPRVLCRPCLGSFCLDTRFGLCLCTILAQFCPFAFTLAFFPTLAGFFLNSLSRLHFPLLPATHHSPPWHQPPPLHIPQSIASDRHGHIAWFSTLTLCSGNPTSPSFPGSVRFLHLSVLVPLPLFVFAQLVLPLNPLHCLSCSFSIPGLAS